MNEEKSIIKQEGFYGIEEDWGLQEGYLEISNGMTGP